MTRQGAEHCVYCGQPLGYDNDWVWHEDCNDDHQARIGDRGRALAEMLGTASWFVELVEDDEYCEYLVRFDGSRWVAYEREECYRLVQDALRDWAMAELGKLPERMRGYYDMDEFCYQQAREVNAGEFLHERTWTGRTETYEIEGITYVLIQTDEGR